MKGGGLLDALFVLVKAVRPGTPSGARDLLLLPLSSECTRELMASALGIGEDDGSASRALGLLPDHARLRGSELPALHHTYALLPCEEEDRLAAPAAVCFLVQCVSVLPTSTHESPEHERDNGTLDAVLARTATGHSSDALAALGATSESMCQWRACSALVADASSPVALCPTHTLMLSLVQRDGSAMDQNKYITKRLEWPHPEGNAVEDKELRICAKLSSLVQDVCSGGLRRSLKAFLKKRHDDMKFANLLSNVMNVSSRPQPFWSKYRTPEDMER